MLLIDLSILGICSEAWLVDPQRAMSRKLRHPSYALYLLKAGLDLDQAIHLLRDEGGAEDWKHLDRCYPKTCFKLLSGSRYALHICDCGIVLETEGMMLKLEAPDYCVEEARRKLAYLSLWIRVAPPKTKELILSRVSPTLNSLDEGIDVLRRLGMGGGYEAGV